MAISVTPIKSFAEIKKIAEEGDLWIINNTDLGNSRPRGNIALSIKDANGETIPVVLQATWIPINVATMCDPVAVATSQQFRSEVGKNNVVVITNKEAAAILEREDAKIEQEEVENFRRGLSKANGTTPVMSDSSKISITTNNSGSSSRSLPQIAQSDAVENINEDDNILHKMVAEFNSGILTNEHAEEAFPTLNPSLDALKTASGNIQNTGSKFFNMVADAISG